MAFTTELVLGQGGGVASQAVTWDTSSLSQGAVGTIATISTGKTGNWRIFLAGFETNHDRGSGQADWVVNGTNVTKFPSLLGSAIGTGFEVAVSNTDTVSLAIRRNDSRGSGVCVGSGTVLWWPL